MIKSLGLSPEVGRVHIGFMGSHGALNGMRAAHAIAASDPHATVLLCAVELCTLHFQYGWNRDQMVANSLFADGAAALIVSSRTDANVPRESWDVCATGSFLFADSEDAMSWNIGDHGFEMTLSPRVPDLIVKMAKTIDVPAQFMMGAIGMPYVYVKGDADFAEDDRWEAFGKSLFVRSERVGTLEVLELQKAGGKKIPATEFLRGHALPPAAIFGAPI